MGKPSILIGVGVFIALAAFFMTYSYLSGQSDGVVEQKVEYRQVAVAAVDVARGDLIDADHVKIVDWPAHAVPEGAVSDPEQILGKVARIALLANEPITENKLAKNRSSSLLSMLLPAGRRAMSVKVNEVTGISGFVGPGSHVDVLMSVRERDDEPAKSKIILQGIAVLAIDQTIEQVDNDPSVVNTVTLDVSPAQSEVLTLAANEGSLQLALRNDADASDVYTSGRTIDQITSAFGTGSVEVIRGKDIQTVNF